MAGVVSAVLGIDRPGNGDAARELGLVVVLMMRVLVLDVAGVMVVVVRVVTVVVGMRVAVGGRIRVVVMRRRVAMRPQGAVHHEVEVGTEFEPKQPEQRGQQRERTPPSVECVRGLAGRRHVSTCLGRLPRA